jgi:hypothetical protein
VVRLTRPHFLHFLFDECDGLILLLLVLEQLSDLFRLFFLFDFEQFDEVLVVLVLDGGEQLRAFESREVLEGFGGDLYAFELEAVGVGVQRS